MKITKEIVNVLKNFSMINKSIMVYPGKKLRTISETKTVFAEYEFSDVEFPIEFGIYSIVEFLSVLSLFEEPELNFKKDHMIISSPNSKTSVKYVYASERVIITPGKEKTINFPGSDIDFELSSDNLNLIKKASPILKAEELVIEKVDDSDEVVLKLQNGANVNSNTFDIKIPVTQYSEVMQKCKINANHMLFMPDNYQVSCSSKGIVKVYNSRSQYFVPALKD